MIDELKLLVELFQGATQTALYAFLAYGAYKLASLALIVLPIYKAVIFLISAMFPSMSEVSDAKTTTPKKTKIA